MIKVKKVSKRRGGVTRITLNTGQRLDWPTPVVSAAEIEEGENLTEQELKKKLFASAQEIIGEKAREYLGRYLKTCSQFENHFANKGYPRELLEPLIEELKREGYLNDEEVARQHIHKRCRSKPRGKQKLLAELTGKGINQNLARKIINEEIDDQRERELAEKYCQKNSSLSPEKLAGRLKSRGFPAAVIYELLRQSRG